MATARVDPGICGLETVVTVTRLSRIEVGIEIESECEMIAACRPILKRVAWRDALDSRSESCLQKLFAAHVRHTGCIVPAAVAKAIEIEIGAALPRDVHVAFQRTDRHTGN